MRTLLLLAMVVPLFVACTRQPIQLPPSPRVAPKTNSVIATVDPSNAHAHAHESRSCLEDGKIANDVGSYTKQLGDYFTFADNKIVLWKLTQVELSNMVNTALKDERASKVLYLETLGMQCRRDDENRAITNAYRPILEYIYQRLWHESPYPAVRYDAASTLLLEYANTIEMPESSRLFDELNSELNLGQTLAEDTARGIEERIIGRIDYNRLIAAACRGNEETYCSEVARIEKKWNVASRKSQLEITIFQHNALSYKGASVKMRDKYLPGVLSRLSEDEIKNVLDDENMAKIVREKKQKYNIK